MAARIALALLRGYKVLFSPLFTGSCRFLPSCADYMTQGVERFGALRGLWMGVGRLLRCQPLCRAGFDPVPARFSVRSGWIGQFGAPDAGAR